MEKGERTKTEGRYVNIEAARRQEQAGKRKSLDMHVWAPSLDY